MRLTSVPALVLALAALPAAGAAQQVSPAEGFKWSGRIAEGRTLTVESINGNVDATAGNTATVAVSVRSKRGRSTDGLRIRVEESADGAVFCVIYPEHPDDTCEHEDGKRRRGRNHDHDDGDRSHDAEVNFTVTVPAGVQFEGRTVNGSVRATGLGADTYASAVNGDVEISTKGIAEGSTVNGNVSVRMGRGDWPGSIDLTTVNGDVTVELPGEPDAEIRASTLNGEISSDFPMMVKGRNGPRRLTGTIGKGGRVLALSNVNGDIAVRRASR